MRWVEVFFCFFLFLFPLCLGGAWRKSGCVIQWLAGRQCRGSTAQLRELSGRREEGAEGGGTTRGWLLFGQFRSWMLLLVCCLFLRWITGPLLCFHRKQRNAIWLLRCSMSTAGQGWNGRSSRRHVMPFLEMPRPSMAGRQAAGAVPKRRGAAATAAVWDQMVGSKHVKTAWNSSTPARPKRPGATYTAAHQHHFEGNR